MTPELDKALLEEYASLKSEEKRVAERIAELSPTIKEAMRANDVDKVETEFGNFTMSDTTRWQYSPAIAKLQEHEKANGKARKLITTTLRFTAPRV